MAETSKLGFHWRGIQIEVDLPKEVLEKIQHILEHVQFISFIISQEQLEDNQFHFRDGKYAKFIAGVLSCAPKLKSLQMAVNILENDLSEVWSCPIIRHNLKNLESLELPHLGFKSNDAKTYRTIGSYRQIRHTYSPISKEFMMNFQQLATIVETAPSRLKRLQLPKYQIDSPNNPESTYTREAALFTRSFLDLLQSHRESLVEVSIPVYAWDWNVLKVIRSLTSTHLKSLTTVAYPSLDCSLEHFLKNHPKLKELKLTIMNDFTSGMKEDMWKAIKRRCAAAGAYLNKVNLKTFRNFWKEIDVLDWSFLEEMKALENFQIEIIWNSRFEVMTDSFGFGPSVLESLSRIGKLERLSLNGIHIAGSFWKLFCSPEGQGTPIVTDELPLATKFDLLGRFRSLKHLSFRHSMNAVDDDVIQFIFREMTSLEELEVSHCERLTDVGIAGTGSKEDEKVSIRSLKGKS